MEEYRLIDTHCHLNAPQFDPDRGAALERARAARVALCVDVGTAPPEWERSLALAGAHPDVRCALGLHPNSAAEWTEEMGAALRDALRDARVIAVGETGLDWYRMGAPPEAQRTVFVRHLTLARELGLPVVVHCRDAYDDALAVISTEGAGTTGVMHSFAGTPEQAARTIALGWYVSLSGPVTYKSGGAIREVARTVPLDRLLVETDSPYLPPHPHRGQRNEPAYVALTAAAIADARGMPVAELARATTENARRLLQLRT